jgi:hypothetical protein
MKQIILVLGVVIIGFSSCTFTSSSSGSIKLETTKDSMDIIMNDVKEIVESLDHDNIKKQIIAKFKDFDETAINNIYISYTKLWSEGEDATVTVRVNVSSSNFDDADGIIDFYESFIISELKKNGYTLKE